MYLHIFAYSCIFYCIFLHISCIFLAYFCMLLLKLSLFYIFLSSVLKPALFLVMEKRSSCFVSAPTRNPGRRLAGQAKSAAFGANTAIMIHRYSKAECWSEAENRTIPPDVPLPMIFDSSSVKPATSFAVADEAKLSSGWNYCHH